VTGLLAAALLVLSAATPATAADTYTGTLREAVRLLPVAPERNAGYDREGAFGGGWADADGDCQSTRHEVLVAESTVPATLSASGCTVVSGRWPLPFEGGAVVTAASALEVDHLVPLAEAWGSGAQAWSPERRMAFANDLHPASLNASTSAWNQAKAAKGPEEFVPTSAVCAYVAAWVGVKVRWGLSVDDVERRALLRYADVDCPPQALSVELAGTAPVLSPPPTTPATPVPDVAGTKRLAGSDRYATAATVVADSFAGGTVPVAFVASGQGFADALAGGPAAAHLGGPVLTVTRTGIPASVRAELARLQPARIVVLGGTGAVSAAVAGQLDGFTSGPVTRLAGSTRYGTAARIATSTFAPGVPRAFVATGAGFADALAGGAAAALTGSPVLLVGRTGVPAETAAALRVLRPGGISVLGGTSAVSDTVLQALRGSTSGTVDRLAGSDRASTAARVARVLWPQTSVVVYLATGRDFPDALAGVPAAGLDRAPLLLVEPGCMPAVTKRELERLRPTTTVVLGGTSSVSAAAAAGVVCGAAAPVTDPPPAALPPRPADVDCSDFTTQAAAQAFYDRWFPSYGDVARLDGSDGDGRVCETLP
jgi:putative cell wall-binding protein